MVTNAGGGSSRWKDLAVTRWREDTTCDDWGTFCYLRDVASGEFWSTAHQPTLKQAEHYEAIFSEGRAEFRRRDLDFETHTEIVVSPEDDIEVRRVTHHQPVPDPRGRSTSPVMRKSCSRPRPRTRCIRRSAISSCKPKSSRAGSAILCTRRPRSVERAGAVDVPSDDRASSAAHRRCLVRDRPHAVSSAAAVRSPRPLAMIDPGALSDTDGSVLDPIAAIRHRLIIDAGAYGDDRHGLGRRRDARCRAAASSTNIRIAVSPIACSS